MSTSFQTALTSSSGLKRIHALLAIQSIVVLLVSVNRLGPFSLGYVAGSEFLRWVDFNNMLPLPLVSLAAFYLLKSHLEASSAGRAGKPGGTYRLLLSILFVSGAYLLGAGYGSHEVTNYLHARFCAGGATSDLCRIVIFNDDEFSHWVFFAGFISINTCLMLWQVLFPSAARLQGGDAALLVFNAVFIAAGIFANLAFEQIGLDLYVVALLAGFSLYLLRRTGKQPLLVYYSAAYCLGLAATAVYLLASGGPG